MTEGPSRVITMGLGAVGRVRAGGDTGWFWRYGVQAEGGGVTGICARSDRPRESVRRDIFGCPGFDRTNGPISLGQSWAPWCHDRHLTFAQARVGVRASKLLLFFQGASRARHSQ